MLPVEFLDTARETPHDHGLWLSYQSYRNLEANIIAMRAYIADLTADIAYYRQLPQGVE